MSDVDAVKSAVKKRCEALGIVGAAMPPHDLVQRMCAHAQELHAATLKPSLIGSDVALEQFTTTGSDDEARVAKAFGMLRAAELFHEAHSHWPRGEDDVSALLAFASKISPAIADKDLAHIVAGFSGAQLHSLSAMLGGVVATEVIKLLTKQLVVIQNTFVLADTLTGTFAL